MVWPEKLDSGNSELSSNNNCNRWSTDDSSDAPVFINDDTEEHPTTYAGDVALPSEPDNQLLNPPLPPKHNNQQPLDTIIEDQQVNENDAKLNVPSPENETSITNKRMVIGTVAVVLCAALATGAYATKSSGIGDSTESSQSDQKSAINNGEHGSTEFLGGDKHYPLDYATTKHAEQNIKDKYGKSLQTKDYMAKVDHEKDRLQSDVIMNRLDEAGYTNIKRQNVESGFITITAQCGENIIRADTENLMNILDGPQTGYYEDNLYVTGNNVEWLPECNNGQVDTGHMKK